MKIWIVDAFTDTPFKGNPAVVALVNDFPERDLCQKIAAEFNLPETGFVKPLGQDHFHIRWFTPRVEAELCGHGTLAAAHVLFQEGYIKGDKINFDSLYGPLFVKKEGDGFVLDFPLLRIEKDFYPMETLKDLLKLKSLTLSFVSHNAVIAELADEEELRHLALDPEKVKQIDHNGLLLQPRGINLMILFRVSMVPGKELTKILSQGRLIVYLPIIGEKSLEKMSF